MGVRNILQTFENLDSFLKKRVTPSTLLIVKKWLTVLGSLLLMLPIGLPWYWGNMAMYTLSYVVVRGDSMEGIHTPWIISFYFMFNAVGLFIAGTASKHTGKKCWILLFGTMLYLSGVFLTYFAVKKSFSWMNFTLGVLSGLGGGVVHGMALQYAVGWAGNDLGLVNSLVQSGYNAGSIFLNPFITIFLNPDNLPPDTNFDQSKIFSTPVILDRVPSFFLMLGSLFLILFFLGFVLVRDTPSNKYYDMRVNDDSDNEEMTELLDDKKRSATSIDTTVSHQATVEVSYNTKKEERESLSKMTSSMEVKDYTPSEMIKTKTFLTLCISLMMYDNAMLVLANYYKEFGATFIEDDHFLTFLGTVLTATTVIAFPFWGLLTDQIGVKKTLVSMFSISSILCFILFFTPRIGKLLYLMNIASFGSFLTPIYSILIIATCKMYGKTYYSSNIGILSSLSLLCNFVNPIIFEKILNIGWFYIFCYGGCLTGTALVFIILTLPEV